MVSSPISLHERYKTDIDIAREAKKRPILELGKDRLGIAAENLDPYGHFKAKISLPYIRSLESKPDGKLILVSAITPTPAGEGKTTTTVGLGDGLNRIGKKALICLREPSLGPCFGVKGGAAGGGYAQVVPMEDINLHFTGDFHAIGAAHNLLAAMVDNHLYWGNTTGLDARRVNWRRAVDMNDRALRNIVLGLGGAANGVPREGGYDITVASEVMAILCLSRDLADLTRRLGAIVVGETRERAVVTARQLKADGAMAILLKEAIAPNLAQSLEGTPAFVHGGPFANIAHGCNSLMATETGLHLADFVVTEAGFGADLGAEKFFDIKCRKGGLRPDAAAVVATVRALKMHGGVARNELGKPDIAALQRGLANLGRHLDNLAKFGVPVAVGINRFGGDTTEELEAVRAYCATRGVPAQVCTHWADGGKGAEALGRDIIALADSGKADFRPLYPDAMPLAEKARTIAREIYGAADIALDARARDGLARFEALGFGHVPVCMAKTQYSFSTNPDLRGAPSGHTVAIREVRLAAGAEFVVAICGDIMTMPGLPRVPAAEGMSLDEAGNIVGLS